MAHVEISNSRYVRSHGRAPRGVGLWLFETPVGRVAVQHNGTLRDAKQAARKWAQENGLRLMFVCP